MVADAGHDGHAVEDAGGAEEEMIPVGALVAAVDEVAGEQNEIDGGVPAMSGGEQPAPALEAGLGIAQVQEAEPGCAGGRGLDGAPWSPTRRRCRRPGNSGRRCLAPADRRRPGGGG